jgi:hypothetical protein
MALTIFFLFSQDIVHSNIGIEMNYVHIEVDDVIIQ